MTTVVFIGAILFALINTGSAKYISYINQEKNWEEARDYCKNQCNGRLVHLDNNTYSSLSRIIHNVNTEIWTGIYTTMSGWIEILGCYHYADIAEYISTQRKYTRFELKFINEVSRKMVSSCQMHCHQHGYHHFAVQTTVCHCLQRLPPEIKQSKPSDCSYPCISAYKGLCGAKNHVSLFRTILENLKERVTNHKDCIYVDCLDHFLYPARCGKLYGWICKNETHHYYRILPTETYINSFKDCYEKGTYLTVDRGNTCHESNLNFWVGCFRQHGFQWIGDNVIDSYDECGYISVITKLKRNRCSKKKHFVCEYESEGNCMKDSILVEKNAADSISTYNTDKSDKDETVTDSHLHSTSDILSTSNYTSVDSEKKNTGTLTKAKMQNEYRKEKDGSSVVVVVGAVAGASISLVITVIIIIAVIKKNRRKIPEEKSKVTKVQTDLHNHASKNVYYDHETDTISGNLVRSGAEGIPSSSTEIHENVSENPKNNQDLVYDLANQDNDTEYTYVDKTIEQHDMYYSAADTQYDCMNGSHTRKIKLTQDAIYDHSQLEGDMYDTTRVLNESDEANDTYDHTQVGGDMYDTTRVLAKNDDTNNTYDHA